MSTSWYTIFGPSEWPGVSIKTGNKKIDGTYYNVLGNKNIQLSASGVMWLVAGSGIRLISPEYVDASGIRVANLLARQIRKIDNAGQIVPTYIGNSGAILYKQDDNNAAGIPGNELVYDTTIGKLTMPSKPVGVLYVGSGTSTDPGAPPTKQIDSFSEFQLIPSRSIPQGQGIPPLEIPARVEIDAETIIKKSIQIYPDIEGYKDSILTHRGSGVPAEWMPAEYLKADGTTWIRFPKRPVMVTKDSIIFYTDKPSWAIAWSGDVTVETLEKEFGITDTVELINAGTRRSSYVKLATTTTYVADEPNTPDGVDVLKPLIKVYTENTTVIDPDDENIATGQTPRVHNNAIAVKICYGNGVGGQMAPPPTGNAYAFSVTKGAYMHMQLASGATGGFSCDSSGPTPFKFKPSSANYLTIRPKTSTGFNTLAEDIDFAIYGQYKTPYNNYDPVFTLDSRLSPTGLIPAFKVDANVPNAASGTIESGVLYTKFLDRARVTPTGWNYDDKPKLLINTNKPYIIASLPTGTNNDDKIYTYADLTISGVTYSNELIVDKLFVNPKPLPNNSGTYIANSLLTIDRSGRIISRVPRTNPVVPGPPTGLVLDSTHPNNGIGNAELSISWQAPSNDGRSIISDYSLEFSINEGLTWTAIPNNIYTIDKPQPTGAIRLATIGGLSPLMNYQFRVAAINGIGKGEFSEASAPMMPGSSVPKKPVNLNYTRVFDETLYSDIVLTWETSHAGESDILGYVIEESQDNGISWQYYNAPSLNSLIVNTTETISGSESAINYVYRVSAWNSFGASAFAYLYVQGNTVVEIDPEEAELEQEKKDDVLSNWDFGQVLFTGVCPT